MKSKFAFGLAALLVVLALAPASYAQINLQAFSAPSSQEIQTNRTAQTADPTSSGAGITVSGSVVADAVVTGTSLFIDYPGVITADAAIGANGPVPVGDPIRLEAQTGIFLAATIVTVDYDSGVVEIALPTDNDGTLTSGSFRLVGVRIDANGLTAPVSATLSLGSSSNNYILSTTSVPVINAFGPGIGSMAIGARSGQTNSGSASIFTNAVANDAEGSLLITEGFASAWRTEGHPGSATAAGRTVSNSTQIRLTFSGLADGQTLALVANPSSGTAVTLSSATVDEDDNEVIIDIDAAGLTTVNSIQIDYTVTGTGTAPLTPGAITVTATMFPIGSPLDDDGVPTDDDCYPCFAQSDVGPVTVVSIVAANTTLLVPFAVRDGAYDTGIALANTTADPFGADGGATPQSGPVRMFFYPRSATGGAGTAFTFTTSATARPGLGLDASGNLPAGSTWTVLLSELLAAAGQGTTAFTGYIFIQTDFLGAHGAPFISDFRNFTSFSPMLVLLPPVSEDRSSPGDGAEDLGL